MNKNIFSLNNLLKNNKFVFVVAVLISISVWIYMSMGSSNDTTVTVTNIPIQIELSDEAKQNGLQVFYGGDQSSSVTITGNRAILGSVSASDITVTASASAIDTPGEYQLSVTAAKTNPSGNFEINSSATPSYVTVFVDYYRESSFNIQENVVVNIDSGYYGSTSLSNDTVNISGPQSEVSKIAKVSASAELGDKKINSSTETDCDLILYDSDGNVIESDMINMDITSVTATISVLPEKSVKVVPSYVNKPSGLEITDDMISIDPNEILLAAPKNVLNSTDYVSLESIDFSTLKNEKISFDSIGIDIPSECKNISNSTSAKVFLDLSSFKSKTFTVSKFSVQGLSKEYNASVTQNNMTITVIGPEDQINKLNDASFTALIDTSDMQGTIGSVQMPVTISISGADKCWVYGSYKANLTISKSD